jgi:tight adherence protein B
MMPIVLAVVAGVGVHLLASAWLFGRRRLVVGRRSRPPTRRLARLGIGHAYPRQLSQVVLLPFIAGGAAGLVVFGGFLAAMVAGSFAVALVLGTMRLRERRRRAVAQDAWPTMIEEIRLLVGSIGRSIPQALFDVGSTAPPELRHAFRTAQREWLMSTDFARTVAVLEHELDEASADAACETLLVAHELGGTDVDRRLADLADDRRDDLRYRKDVRARQAGVRFARRFVLLVPLGMAAAGLSIGDGRATYATPMGQLAVSVALVMIAGCWIWAGRLMRLPSEGRIVRDQP